MRRENVRNIAIIAHVDHGKTTLVDCLLRQSGTVQGHKNLQERAMDKLDLERERGITIMSKNTALKWKGVDINVVDTPGHSDFGGEVERVLGMVDCVLLVVDAFEGPMPQTRFVLRKALQHGLRPVVVINKCDRSDSRPDFVLDAIFDLFVSLGATDEQLDFSLVYASARDGWAVLDLEHPHENLVPMLDSIVTIVEGPEVEMDLDFQMQVATIDYDEFVGRIAVGRILRGEVSKGEALVCLDYDGVVRRGKVTRLIGFSGLQQIEIQKASAGDIIGIAGFTEALPGETICHPNSPEGLPPIIVDEPTISMDFMANNGPFSGLDGKHVTSRKLRERLYKELQSNVSLKVEDTSQADIFKVSGRGELHLGILIETMRREGYEMTVSMPKVIVREEADGSKSEPYEDVSVDCEDAYSGTVIQELNLRGGELREMRNDGEITRLEFYIPARGLIGYRSKFLTQTRGTGTMFKSFAGFGPFRGLMERRTAGVMVALETGQVTGYSLETLQERGMLFVEPGNKVYGGQVVGESARNQDLVVNPCKAKKLDNIRSATKELVVKLNAPRTMTLEEALEYINSDEWVEVTPNAIRLRKRILNHSDRKRLEKKASA